MTAGDVIVLLIAFAIVVVLVVWQGESITKVPKVRK